MFCEPAIRPVTIPPGETVAHVEGLAENVPGEVASFKNILPPSQTMKAVPVIAAGDGLTTKDREVLHPEESV
jgi:hypothetical protein